jgi:hypothetical protein
VGDARVRQHPAHLPALADEEAAVGHLPVAPRKGQLAMTERAPDFVQRKIIDATYADTVAGDAADVDVATVLDQVCAAAEPLLE